MIFGVRALETERMRLVARCDALRSELVQGIRPYAAKVAAADRLVRAVRRLAPLLLLYSFLKKRR
ncbi:MAG TPA: hypothetical protein VG873_17335 [Burkholderiales bacterium]|nr:hypothetical protein [Burkholderiales bacterium]